MDCPDSHPDKYVVTPRRFGFRLFHVDEDENLFSGLVGLLWCALVLAVISVPIDIVLRMNRGHKSERLHGCGSLHGHKAGVIQELGSVLMAEGSDLPEMQPYNIPKVLAGIKFNFCPSDQQF